MSWQDAYVGTGTGLVAVRVTDEEKERLEQLRRVHGLTSKAQVIRAALDLLEIVAAPGTFLLDGKEGLRENRELTERVKQKLGAAGVGDSPDNAAATVGAEEPCTERD